MSSAVLDASALLALLNQEAGWQSVAEAVANGAAISTVNLSEVAAKLIQRGVPIETVQAAIDPLAMEVVDFDQHLAYRTAQLHHSTRSLGLSLGDRACLALAQQLELPAITADHAWAKLNLGISVLAIR